MLHRSFLVGMWVAAVLVSTSGSALAKRGEPPAVTPVVIGAVEYSAPSGHMGFIDAHDIKTGRLLWSRQIYVIVKDPDLEEDVQDVFISKLAADEKNLLVTNEAGSQFKLDTETLEVQTLKGSVKTGKRA